jgi:hypothetical protein
MSVILEKSGIAMGIELISFPKIVGVNQSTFKAKSFFYGKFHCHSCFDGIVGRSYDIITISK